MTGKKFLRAIFFTVSVGIFKVMLQHLVMLIIHFIFRLDY